MRSSDQIAGATRTGGIEPTTTRSFVWAGGYLVLSGLSGLIELGVLFLAVRGHTLLEVPLYGLAYQLGALLSHPIRLPRSVYVLSGICGCACALVGNGSIVLQCAAILGTSILLQHVRALVGKRCHVTTFWKRIARVCGFLVAPWFGAWSLAGAALGLVACWSVIGRVVNASRVKQPACPSLDILGITMMVHQSHYFLYSCFLPFVFIQVNGIPRSLVGLAFALGWTSYCCAPRLFRGWQPMTAFVLGHLLVFVALLAWIFGSGSTSVVLVAWFISGFGGGTVFCLRDLEQRHRPAREGHLDTWENIGHVSGIVAGIVLISVFGTAIAAFGAASVVALCTALLGILVAKRTTLRREPLTFDLP
jgi:hypothetical protein